MISIKQAIVVEGKYDKIKLSSVINGVIICTDGFGVFKCPDKLKLIRLYAEKTGIIILTDSDSAGFKIRNFIKGAVGEGEIINVYIPDVFGKERRKAAPSKEGKLGVEGMSAEVLTEAFRKAGVLLGEDDVNPRGGGIDKTLLYELGLSGRPDASFRRRELLKRLELPELMTSSAIAELLNAMMSRGELESIADELWGESSRMHKEVI